MFLGRLKLYILSISALNMLMNQAARPNSPLKGHDRTVQYLQHLGKLFILYKK